MVAGRQERRAAFHVSSRLCCCPSPAESVDWRNATSAPSYRRVNARCTIPSDRSPRPGALSRRKVRLLRLPRRCLIGFAGGVPSCWRIFHCRQRRGGEALRCRCHRIGAGTNRGAGQLHSRQIPGRIRRLSSRQQTTAPWLAGVQTQWIVTPGGEGSRMRRMRHAITAGSGMPRIRCQECRWAVADRGLWNRSEPDTATIPPDGRLSADCPQIVRTIGSKTAKIGNL